MKRDDIKVIERIEQVDGCSRYVVIPVQSIEDYSATGENYDYSLSSDDESCETALFDAIEEKFSVPSVDLQLYGCDNDIEYVGYDEDVTNDKITAINAFAKEWRKEHEVHYEGQWYNYHDGSNWQSILLYHENPEIDENKEFRLLDDNEAENIIAAYERACDRRNEVEWDHGYKTIHDEETGLDVRFSQYSNAVGYADIF